MGAVGDVANSARLTFDHNVETEIGFDGGTVQISRNGGAYAHGPRCAYAFNAPSMIATAAAGNTNPLEGQPGFTGSDGGKIRSHWGTSIIDLAQAGVDFRRLPSRSASPSVATAVAVSSAGGSTTSRSRPA